MSRMLAFLILAVSATLLPAQPRESSASADLNKALIGRWVGHLEYRDYSEPATSTKRVQLPTWLTISQAPEGLFFNYVYDDGPTKVVSERSTLVADLDAHTYKVISTDQVLESYSMTGDDKLKAGHGEIILIGKGTDNKKPAEMRIVWTIRRNLLTWLEEVRPQGSSKPFTFRHRYVFTRAEPPQPTGIPPK